MEDYAIAAYRSRTQVLQLEAALKRECVGCQVINTPREVALGCGLSVRFDLADERAVAEVYRAVKPGNLIGFYRAEREADGRLTVRPLGVAEGYSG